MNDDCVLNHCSREQGMGTWVSVKQANGDERQLPVCEEHWQALRMVPR